MMEALKLFGLVKVVLCSSAGNDGDTETHLGLGPLCVKS